MRVVIWLEPRLVMSVDRVAEAKQQFDAHGFYWKHTLAVDLEDRQRGLAVQWAASCAEQLMAVRYPERLSHFATDIADAKLYFARRPDCDLTETAREIWYRKDRDGPQTAISKLFTAIYEYHEGTPCIHSTAAVIGNLFTDTWPDGSEWHADSDKLFQLVMDQHYRSAKQAESK